MNWMMNRMRSIEGLGKSFYLLGPKNSSNLSFQRYLRLMELCALEGEFLSFDSHQTWLSCYERDSQKVQTKLPLLVFRPFTIQSIPPFLRNCHDLCIPVSNRCGGTGYSGGCLPGAEGVVLLTGHLKKISCYDPEKGTLCVEAGVTVRELNRFTASDRWHFSLSMATEGVAGLAGCLSSHARGYHQQERLFYDSIEWVKIADGRGDVFQVPSSFVCGSEGMLGTFLEMKVQLKKIPASRQEFIFRGSWTEFFAQLPKLYSLQVLSFAIWDQDAFHLGLEGDAWRIEPSLKALVKYLPGIEPVAKRSQNTFYPHKAPFVAISTAFDPYQLAEAHQRADDGAKKLGFNYSSYSDILAGSLQLILYCNEDLYSFKGKIEQFLVAWADFVDRKKGMLGNCHGIGMQMGPYMTPFWNEETIKLWKRLKSAFDPKELFGKGQYFPPPGRSLEKTGCSI